MKSENGTKMATPAVSIIVPIFDTEPYIERCARSLFEQTLRDIEIIFVDDASPDKAIAVLESVLAEYPERKAQTRIVRLGHNGGIARARAEGLKCAGGEYVIHCDSDDWADTTLYEAMYRKAKAADADVVICPEILEYADRSRKQSIGQLASSGREIMREWYRNTLGLFVHNKLVRRSVYTRNGIAPWPGLNMWDDTALIARLLYFSDKVVTVSGHYYHYNRANLGSITRTYAIGQVNQMIGVAKRLTRFFSEVPDAADFRKTADAFRYLARINLVKDSYSDYRRFLNTFPESRRIARELDPKAFSPRGRVRFRMVKSGLAPLFIFAFKVKRLFEFK